MSLTELQTHSTLQEIQQHGGSLTSLSIRAGSTHSLEQDVASGLRKVHTSKGDIELAELSSSKDVTANVAGNSPTPPEPVTVETKSFSARVKGYIQFAALCYTLFLCGWNDGSTGPLLPRIQTNYNVRVYLILY